MPESKPDEMRRWVQSSGPTKNHWLASRPRQRLKALKRARRVAHDRFIVIEAGQSIAVPQPPLMPRPENPFRGNAIVGLSSFGVKAMKQALALLAIAGLGVAGCNRAETPEAENIVAAAENEAQALENEAAAVEEMAENRAEAASASLENKAEALRNEAEVVREKAENKAEAIDNAVTNAM